MNKIIFLDVDGVLNSSAFLRLKTEVEDPNDYFLQAYMSIPEERKTYKKMREMIDPKAVKILQSIYEEEPFDIVVSSSWRICHYEVLILILEEYGFKGKVIDRTPCLNRESSVRGNEILQWTLDNEDKCGKYYDFKSYVILDDSDDMLLWQKDNFVQTEWKIGLTEERTPAIIEALRR